MEYRPPKTSNFDNSSSEKTSFENKKWYKQFWPWFLIALPASVVVAGFSTLYIALSNPHSMVNDQYYREGLAINQSLEQDRKALELGLGAQVMFEAANAVNIASVKVVLSSSRDQSLEFPSQLILLMLHPGSQTLDQTLELKQINVGQINVGQINVVEYRADLSEELSEEPSEKLQYSYYLRLMPTEKNWRLNGKINFQQANSAALGFK